MLKDVATASEGAAAGELKLIHEIALKTRAANGSDLVTWGNFQPLYAVVAAQDPSFLD